MTCRHEHCRERIIPCGTAILHKCGGWIHALTGLHGCLGAARTTAEPALAERSTT